MSSILRGAAVIAAMILTACATTTHAGVAPGSVQTISHVARMPAGFAHGAEIESAPTFIVSEGNHHMAFPPGATLVRTANGIEVTYHGVKRTFSSSAKVDAGTYRRYARAQ